MALLRKSLPLRTPIDGGESLDSWIDALARRNRTGSQSILVAMGITRATQPIADLIDHTPPDQLRRIEAATGLVPGRLDLAVGGALLDASRLIGNGSRFCPTCLDTNGGRWLLVWRSRWTIACLRHRLLLLDDCPRCRLPLRTRVRGGNNPPGTGRCERRSADTRVRCGCDLTQATRLPAHPNALRVQTWVDDLHSRRDRREHGAIDVVAALPRLTLWLSAGNRIPDFDKSSTLIDPRRGTAGPTRSGHVIAKSDAASTTVLLHFTARILDGDDASAISTLRTVLRDSRPRLRPPGIPPQHWTLLADKRFGNRYLRAVDAGLPNADRLRHHTPTPAASCAVRDVRARIPMIPELLWTDWSSRLLPTGVRRRFDGLRAALTVLLMVPGAPSGPLNSHASLLNPNIQHRHAAACLQAYAKISSTMLTDVIVVLCRIACYLDEFGSPIDYQRRRERLPAVTIGWDQWRDLACAAGGHPGLAGEHGRLRHVRRHLECLLKGSDLSNASNPLRFVSQRDRSAFTAFQATMPVPVRTALHTYAESVLAEHHIDEPLLWSPPSHLADGLALPGIDVTALDMTIVRSLIVDDHQPAAEAARRLGVQVEHVRLAIEGIDRPPPRLATNSAPMHWERRRQTAAVFTREYFDLEYVQRKRSLAELQAETGFGRHLISKRARELGVELRSASRHLPIDPSWLYEQYVIHRRSISDLATELGIEQATLARALRRHHVPIRSPGTRSFPAMIVTYDHLPLMVRSAVETTLYGWQRLHRFQIAMQFPTLGEAAGYLQIDKTGLQVQLRQIERATGQRLFIRATRRQPQRPTSHGYALLHLLENADVRSAMLAALARSSDPRAKPLPTTGAHFLSSTQSRPTRSQFDR